MLDVFDDSLWRAIVDCSREYDGKLFYAVKTTRIFCRFSCRSRTPNRDNVLVFSSVNEALQAGFRPCKRCRPDLGPLFAPEVELIASARRMLEEDYAKPGAWDKAADRLGISRFHFHRLFKKHTGDTPRGFVARIRVAKARELLADSRVTTADAAFEVGFGSLSAFYETYRRLEGASPRALKKTPDR